MTITNIPDINIHLLNYLDIKSVIRLSAISTAQYVLLSNLNFVKQLHALKRNLMGTNSQTIIDYASQCGYMEIIEWMYNSTNNFEYTDNAIRRASQYGHTNILEWFSSKDTIKYKIDEIYRPFFGPIYIPGW